MMLQGDTISWISPSWIFPNPWIYSRRNKSFFTEYNNQHNLPGKSLAVWHCPFGYLWYTSLLLLTSDFFAINQPHLVAGRHATHKSTLLFRAPHDSFPIRRACGMRPSPLLRLIRSTDDDSSSLRVARLSGYRASGIIWHSLGLTKLSYWPCLTDCHIKKMS